MTAIRIDSHLHVWDLAQSTYAWLPSVPHDLHRSFTPDSAAAELRSFEMDGAVLVHADDTSSDTKYLLAASNRYPWVLGVVGWVQLDDPRLAEVQLDLWTSAGALVGVRHLLHEERRTNFLSNPSVQESLRAVEARNLTLDVPIVWPAGVEHIASVISAVPELKIVIDHLGKPPRDRVALAKWKRDLAQLSQHSNVYAKFSGLRSAEGPYTAKALEPIWQASLELFGADRMMWGSDWPISSLGSSYRATMNVLDELITTLSPSEQQNIRGGTARRFYDLGRNDL